MTTIAGVVHKGRCYLGGDSAVSFGSGVILQAEPKVFRRGNVLIGIVGRTRWEYMLRRFSPPRMRGDPTTWLTETLGDHVRRSGYEPAEDDEDGTNDEAIIGFNRRIWLLESSGDVYPLLQPFGSIGGGGELARGVLRFTANPNTQKALRLTPDSRVLAALEVAAACTNGTRPPFHVINDGSAKK